MRFSETTITNKIPNDFDFKYNSHYYGIYYDSSIQLKIKDLQYCILHTENTQSWGNFLIGTGLFTSLVLAPLVSINYHNANFNSKRYYHWALAGLTAAGVGLTLNLTH
ncbi:MAG: hypothetical protein SGJ10_10205 [Bacteroidota bacterium]|nr:hypothetical protein [Bacteroidota bacterium]